MAFLTAVLEDVRLTVQLRVVRSPFGTGAPVTRPATAAAAMVCSSRVRGETPSSIEARSRSSNSGVTCQILPPRCATFIDRRLSATIKSTQPRLSRSHHVQLCPTLASITAPLQRASRPETVEVVPSPFGCTSA